MKNKLAHWYKKYITNEAVTAFEYNNVKKLQDLKNMGHDIIDLLNFEKHPLLIAIEEKRIPLVIYFIKNNITEKILEEALILTKKEKSTEIEKIIILQTQEIEERKKHYLTHYNKQKKQEKIINKNNL
jgi:hypothetical protein